MIAHVYVSYGDVAVGLLKLSPKEFEKKSLVFWKIDDVPCYYTEHDGAVFITPKRQEGTSILIDRRP